MKTCLALMAMVCAVLVAAPAASAQQVGTRAERAVIRAAVHVAALGLGAVAVKPGGAYDVDVIRRFVDAVRFMDDTSGYFFVYDYTTNVNVAHAALKDFPGKDKTDYQDSRGLFVIRELSRLAKSPAHAGFLAYYWNNPLTGKEESKLGYVEVIPGTTLYIGSGVYARQRSAGH